MSKRLTLEALEEKLKQYNGIYAKFIEFKLEVQKYVSINDELFLLVCQLEKKLIDRISNIKSLLRIVKEMKSMRVRT